ncbi:unnamed protein product, partial [Iphiclides podalirius]
MLLQRRSLRSRLDLLRGECAVQKRVLDSQQRQVEYAGGVPREFALGDKVWARDFGSNDKWVKGVIEQKEGSRRYILGNGDGQRIKRHIDQIRRRSRLSDVTCPDVANDVERASNGPEDEFADACSDLQTEGVASATERNKEAEEAEGSDDTPGDTPVVSDAVSEAPTPPHLSPPVTRPKRIRRPVIRYN